jgi:hypothetical protein
MSPLNYTHTTGMAQLTIINASRGSIHDEYENLKRKLYNCNANIYFNQQRSQKQLTPISRWQVRASSYNSNKLTNQMQQFHKFLTWRLCVAQHVSGASTSIITSSQLH